MGTITGDATLATAYLAPCLLTDELCRTLSISPLASKSIPAKTLSTSVSSQLQVRRQLVSEHTRK